MSFAGLELPSGQAFQIALAAGKLVRRCTWRLAWRQYDLRGQWEVVVTLPGGVQEYQLAVIDRQLGVRAQGVVRGAANGRGPLEYDVQVRWETMTTISYRPRGGGGPGEGDPGEYSSGLLRMTLHDRPREFHGLGVSTESPGGDLIPIRVDVKRQ